MARAARAVNKSRMNSLTGDRLATAVRSFRRFRAVEHDISLLTGYAVERPDRARGSGTRARSVETTRKCPVMRLADFILSNIESILVEWESFARGIAPGAKMESLA